MPKRRPYKRTDRLSSAVREVLANVLQREPREEALQDVVITAVEVTRDLSVARVWYYALRGDPAAVAGALERAKGFLRMRLGQEVRMRIVPELRFQVDESIERGRRVEAILRDLHAEDAGPPSGDEPSGRKR